VESLIYVNGCGDLLTIVKELAFFVLKTSKDAVCVAKSAYLCSVKKKDKVRQESQGEN